MPSALAIAERHGVETDWCRKRRASASSSARVPASSARRCHSARCGERLGSPSLGRGVTSGGERAPASLHAQLGQGGADRVERAAHLSLAERADAADAEGVGDGKLAGVEHVALLADAVVEKLEVEAR